MIKSEHENEHGEVIRNYVKPGTLISLTSVFVGKIPLKSYVTATDCEVLITDA